MATFTYDSATRIHYDCYGDGEDVIILVHGFGDTRETWREIVPFLAVSHRLFVIDLLGSGLSSKPRESNYSILNHVAIITAFLLDRGLNRISLIGHSLGGAIALKLALDLTERTNVSLDHLVLIDAAGLPQEVPSFIKIPTLPILGPLIIYGVPARLQSYVSIRPVYRIRGTYGPERSLRYARSLRSSGGARALIMTAKAIVADRFAPWFQDLSILCCKTLIIWGSDDPVIPVAHAHVLKQEILYSEMFIATSCGHVPQEELPDIIGPVISRFLRNRTDHGN